MDANDTRYHLLLGQADWHRCDADASQAVNWSLVQRRSDDQVLAGRGGRPPAGTSWDAAYSELTLEKRLFQFVAAPRDIKASLSDRRAAAQDRYGNWYFLDRTHGEVRVRSAGSEGVTKFWNADDGVWTPAASDRGDFTAKEELPPPQQLSLAGVAVTTEHYLAVGSVEPPGLLLFDLHAGAAPHFLTWPPGVPFVPFDMAAMPDGGLAVLDRLNKRYWLLDRQFAVVNLDQEVLMLREETTDAFQPRDGDVERRTPARTFPKGIRGDASAPLDALDPIAIEAVNDGTVLILDLNPGGDAALVHRYRLGQRLAAPASSQGNPASPLRVKAHDFAFVPAHADVDSPSAVVPDRLYIISEEGNQAFVYDVDLPDDGLGIELRNDYLPVRLFGRRGITASGGRAWYDFGEDATVRWLPLVEQSRPRYVEEAILFTPVFDGRDPNCTWHRLMLDACIPPDAAIGVCSRAAENRVELLAAPWSPEPQPYLRGEGSELPFVAREVAPTALGAGTWELLLQAARGRYLQLMLVLRGDGRTTPRLRALRAYYPRFSYLTNYLPAAYREDRASASFLDRFLANFEGLFTTLEDRIAAAQVLFDFRSAPADALEWLGGWLGVAFDSAWEEDRRRLFIKHAMTFFQYRGTMFGLKMALRLALDACVDDSIFDPIAARGRGRARTDTVRLTERGGHAFTVQLPATAGENAHQEAVQRRLALAERVIRLQKPAHTVFDMIFYWAMFRVGEARLGEDSLLAQAARAQLLPPMVLGASYLMESTLEPSHPQNIKEPRFVVGRDTAASA